MSNLRSGISLQRRLRTPDYLFSTLKLHMTPQLFSHPSRSADIYETATDFYLNDFIDVDMFRVSAANP